MSVILVFLFPCPSWTVAVNLTRTGMRACCSGTRVSWTCRGSNRQNVSHGEEITMGDHQLQNFAHDVLPGDAQIFCNCPVPASAVPLHVMRGEIVGKRTVRPHRFLSAPRFGRQKTRMEETVIAVAVRELATRTTE